MCEAGRESSGRLLTYPRSSHARWIESRHLSKSLVEMESRLLHWTAASHPPADISRAGLRFVFAKISPADHQNAIGFMPGNCFKQPAEGHSTMQACTCHA